MASLNRALAPIAWLVPVGVLVQAVIAGQAWFLSPELFGLHGGLGHGVLALAVITAALAWARGGSRVTAWLATAAVLGLVAQIGLGYSGHRAGEATASALHVPLGVALLGLSVAVAMSATWQRAGTPRAAQRTVRQRVG